MMNVNDIVGKRFVSKKQKLEYEVISFEYNYSKMKSRYYKIRFVKSGYEYISRRDYVLNGDVYDKEYRKSERRISIDVNDIVGNRYVSLSQKLEYEVIKYSRANKQKIYYIIRFIKSGNEYEYSKDLIVYGRVHDNSVQLKRDTSNIVGKVYTNKKGLSYRVLDKSNIPGKYIIQFTLSGYKRDCNKYDIMHGLIADRTMMKKRCE